MESKIFLMNKKDIKKNSETPFVQYLERIYCLKNDIMELNEIKALILGKDINGFNVNLSSYKDKNDNNIVLKKAIKNLQMKVDNLKYEVIKLMYEENIIEDIMMEFELQWDKAFIHNKEYLIKIYDKICLIGIVEYIEKIYKSKKAGVCNE